LQYFNSTYPQDSTSRQNTEVSKMTTTKSQTLQAKPDF